MSGWLVLVQTMAAAGGGPFSIPQLRRLTPNTFDNENDNMFVRAESLGLVQCRAFQRGEDPGAGFARERPLPRSHGLPRAWRLTPKGWAAAQNKLALRAPRWTCSFTEGRPRGTVHRLVPTWLSALPEDVRLAPTQCAPGAIELAPGDPRLHQLPDGALVVIRRAAAAEGLAVRSDPASLAR